MYQSVIAPAMPCPACGAGNSQVSNFCHHCGARITAQPPRRKTGWILLIVFGAPVLLIVGFVTLLILRTIYFMNR